MEKSEYRRARAIVRQLQVMTNATVPANGDKSALEKELQSLYEKFRADTDIRNLHEHLCLENYYFRGFSHKEIMQNLYGNGMSSSYSANRIYNVFQRKKLKHSN